QVLGEVRGRERGDAVVLCFRTAHHSLAPPVIDQPLAELRAVPVEAVEWSCGDLAVELGPVGQQRGPELVEEFGGKSVRVALGTHHDRRYGTDQHSLGNSARL